MKTAVLLAKPFYLRAIRSAQAKDSTIRYRMLKTDRSISLLYNPLTWDGKFSTKLAARAELPNGYYEAFPWLKFSETLAENNANLLKYGWPDYSSEGV